MTEPSSNPFSFLGPIPELYRQTGLNDLYILHERTGHVLWRGGAFLELAYPDGGALEQRQRMIDIWEDYFNLFQDYLTHYLKMNARRSSRIQDHQFPEYFREVVPTLPPQIDFDGRLKGYVDARDGDPTPYAIDGIGISAFYKNSRLRSLIDAYFHSGWYLQHKDTILEYTLKWCDSIKPLHGLSGLCLIRDFSSPPYYEGDPSAFPVLRRYPGLDYMDTSRFSFIVRNRLCIRGVNWLTIINDQLIDMLGGHGKMMDGLNKDERITVYGYDGGVLIRAGERPQVGDNNEGLVPEEYRTVSRVLKPIRFEDYTKGYFRVPEPLDEVEETLRWVRRFD